MIQWSSQMIVQAVIAVLVVLTICTMIVLGKEVPKEMWAFGGLVLGWFSAGGAGIAISAIRQAKAAKLAPVPKDHTEFGPPLTHLNDRARSRGSNDDSAP